MTNPIDPILTMPATVTVTRAPITSATQTAIADAFTAIPPEKRGALLVLADQNGARVMTAAKLGASWKVAAEVAKPWYGAVTGTVAIIGAW